MSEEFLVQKPTAVWNTELKLWIRSEEGNLFSEHSELYAETFPTSGMTVAGQLYEQPMPELPITVPESSLLRSPKASEGSGGALGEAEALRRGNTVGVRDQVLDLVAGQGLPVSRAERNDLLPTPNTMEHREIKTPEQIAELKAKSPGGYRNLREVVINELDLPALMPTPTTRDYKDGQSPHLREGVVQVDTVGRAVMNSGEIALLGTPRTSSANGSTQSQVALGAPKARLEDQVESAKANIISWGKFEPAILRWQAIIDRPAPAPTLPDGRGGAHRLSPWLCEWMMGLPEGWLCDPELGLTRNQMLKAAGNGVVPQQAYLALQVLGVSVILGKDTPNP